MERKRRPLCLEARIPHTARGSGAANRPHGREPSGRWATPWKARGEGERRDRPGNGAAPLAAALSALCDRRRCGSRASREIRSSARPPGGDGGAAGEAEVAVRPAGQRRGL